MISVCMATYNGEKYITEQLQSILQQLGESDEVIISDDSSTDNTCSIINAFNDKRIILLQGNKFHSTIYNLENALKNAGGEYIFLADQDDVWQPGKVKKCMEQLTNYDCVCHNARIVDGQLKDLGLTLFDVNKSRNGFLHNLVKNGFTGCCMAFRSSVLSYALPFPGNIPMHDSWIGLLAIKKGKVIFLDDELILYRRHGNNVSNTGSKSDRKISAKIMDRLVLKKQIKLRTKGIEN